MWLNNFIDIQYNTIYLMPYGNMTIKCYGMIIDL